jgi:hypothetical protein
VSGARVTDGQLATATLAADQAGEQRIGHAWERRDTGSPGRYRYHPADRFRAPNRHSRHACQRQLSGIYLTHHVASGIVLHQNAACEAAA